MRKTAHLAQLIVTIVIIGALVIYVGYKAREREPYPRWINKWGPFILVLISFPLILADPVRHVLSDNDIWYSCQRRCGDLWPRRCRWSSNEYHCQVICLPKAKYIPTKCQTIKVNTPKYNQCVCDNTTKDFISCICVHDSQENIHHLSVIGTLFTAFFTYTGFALFIWGAFWNANIVEKCEDIRYKWRELRGLEEPL